MSIDLRRFHATFFEESFEGVDVMERGLLRLDEDAATHGGAADLEEVNAIFRAAHSIKGGAATFGFSAVAEFTHNVETLLDQMRSGARPVSRQAVDLLLRAVDAVRGLLTGARDGSPVDPSLAAGVQKDLQHMLSASEQPAAAAIVAAGAAAAPVGAGFAIRFAAKPDLFRSGNDPLLILRELSELGTLEAELDIGRLPAFDEADPESCYFAWSMRLQTQQPRAAVKELFAWVEDECELEIAPLGAPAPPAAESPAAVAATEPTAAATAPAHATAGTTRAAEPATAGDSGTIRVGTEKIDALINLVGELVITQAMLFQHAGALDPVLNEKLLTGLQLLDRNTRQIQEAVLATRMLPIEAVFNRYPRMLRDLAARLGKQVRLETVGEATELDKGVIEKIIDPLTHLVRNSVDHGIEPPDARVAAGKPPEGLIRLSAAHQGGHICVVVEDDGRGLDRAKLLAKARAQGLPVSDSSTDSEVWQIIFAPGFSTKQEVTDVSGRGVGMDVVKRNIQSLGGQVELESVLGQGMRVSIRLPLTLAILDGMSVAVGEETFIVPLNCVVESLQPTAEHMKSPGGRDRLVRVRDEYVPLISLHSLFRVAGPAREPQQGIVVILEAEGRKIALLVDALVGQQQVVIKNLETNYRRVFGVSGATILGDGRVALILDAAALVRGSFQAAAA